MPDLDRRLLESDLDYMVELIEMCDASISDGDVDPESLLAIATMRVRELRRHLSDFQRRYRELHAV